MFGESSAFAGLHLFFDIVVKKEGMFRRRFGCLDISDGIFGLLWLVIWPFGCVVNFSRLEDLCQPLGCYFCGLCIMGLTFDCVVMSGIKLRV